MELSSLTAISPIDGRYAAKTEVLATYFSEMALFKYRVLVEIEYFILLSQNNLSGLPSLNTQQEENLRAIYQHFNEADALKIKEYEKTTNHDIKAVEYFIKDQLVNIGLDKYKEFVHFGLTSQDINNTAVPLSIKEAMEEVYLPQVYHLQEVLKNLIESWRNIPMLAKTHGQPASPTRLGKEIAVFKERITQQLSLLKQVPYAAKFGGATGNYNAHHVAYPEVDWETFGKEFVTQILGLHHSFPTTQIEHYDHLSALLDNLKRINVILIDFARDVWTYISMGYFKQKIKTGEIGSSAMPHKVNPIDFENAEGNLGVANALFTHLSEKLPISRLQRDLTDSTVLRNIGVPFAHTLIALQSLEKGIGKLMVNEEAIKNDLANNWAVVAEGIQTILRREHYPQPYEALKDLTRTNEPIDEKRIHDFIRKLKVSETIKKELLDITPFNYTGI
jgi:adenylosuccinate lyase